MPNITAADIANAGAARTAQNDALTELLTRTEKEKGDLFRSQATEERKAAGAALEATEFRKREQIKLEDALIASARAFGTDVTDPNSVIAQRALQMDEAYNQANAAIDRMTQKQSVGYFDNPLEWLSNQFTIGDDYEAYTAAARKYNLASADLEARNAATQTQITTQKNLKRTESDATIAAEATAIKSAAEVKALAHELAALNTNTEALKFQKAQNQEEFENQYKAFSAQNAAAHLALAQSEAARHAREFEERMALKKMTDEDSAAVAAAITRGLNAADSKQRGIVVTAADVRRGREFLDPATKAAWQRAYNIGKNIEQGNASAVQFGTSPGDTALAIDVSGWTLRAGQETLVKSLKEATAKVATTSVTAGGVPVKLTPAQKVAQVDQVFKNDSAVMATNVEGTVTGYTENIYKSPAVSTLVAKFPFIAESSIVKEVIAPIAAATKTDQIPAGQVVAGVVERIKSGKIKPEQAAEELNVYYGNVIKFNNTFSDFKSVGMEEQKSYHVKLPVPVSTVNPLAFGSKVATAVGINTAVALGISDGKTIPLGGIGPTIKTTLMDVDLSDKTSTTNYLIKRIVGEK